MEYIFITISSGINKNLVDVHNDYIKRIKKFATVSNIEIKTPNNINNQTDINNILEYEYKQITEKIPNNSYIILMDIKGKQLSSEEIAKKINEIKYNGNSKIVFIIGGSNGVHENLKSEVNLKISFGSNTYPHQLFKIMLLEQVYRAEKINNNQKYHK